MDTTQQSTKERVRHYMENRQAQRCAPPPISEIRRQLGWDMLQPARQASFSMQFAEPGNDGRAAVP